MSLGGDGYDRITIWKGKLENPFAYNSRVNSNNHHYSEKPLNLEIPVRWVNTPLVFQQYQRDYV